MKKGVIITIFVFIFLALSVSAATISHNAEDIKPGSFGANHSAGEWDFGSQQVVVDTLNITNKIVTTTQEELEVDSGLNISAGSLYFPDGSSMTTAASGSGGLWTNSSGNATYTIGNVGIGTTSPEGSLHIAIDSSGDALVVEGLGAEWPMIRMINDGISREWRSMVSSAGWFGIQDSTSGNPAYLVIQNNTGRIGIGTTSPEQKLQVVGGHVLLDNWNGYLIKSAGGSPVTMMTLDSSDTARIYNSQVGVTSGGNVGIGTTSPKEKLDVRGNVLIESTGGAELNLNNTASNELWQIVSGFNNGLEIGNVNDNAIDSNAYFYISDMGNVGIGDTTPGEKLDVSGNINATGDICITGGNCLSSASSQGGLWTNSSGNATFTSGNVGIGTTSPLTDLHVNGSSIRMQGTTGFTDYKDVQLWASSNYGISAASNIEVRTRGEFPIFFSTYANERMRIDSDGNVGIGTTSPSAKLEVLGDTIVNGSFNIETNSVGQLNMNGSGDNQYSANQIKMYNYNTSNFWLMTQRGTKVGANNDKLIFMYSDGSTFNGSISLHTNKDVDFYGNVGIGTDSPSKQLEISNSDNTSLQLRSTKNDALWTNGQELAAITVYSDDQSGIGEGVKSSIRFTNQNAQYGGYNDMRFATSFTDGNDVTRMTISAGGGVGIGTTSPSTKLDVGDNSSTGGIITIRGNQSGMQHRDNEGNLDFITGLRSDVSPGNFVFF